MSWEKFLAFQSRPSVDLYPNLMDHLTWMRMGLGFACGLILGYVESKQDTSLGGIAGIISGLFVVIYLPILYITVFLAADTNTYKNLYTQGVSNALALMILIWITFFTVIHKDEEYALTQALLHESVKMSNIDQLGAENMPLKVTSENMGNEF